jgi:hypothetical protein
MFKLALNRLASGQELCSQSTISRLENLPDMRAPLRLGQALVEQYCGSFRAVPKRIVLDIDDTPAFAGAGSSTAFTVVSSCACSTPSTMITAFSRLSCSRRRPLRHGPVAARQASQRGRGSRLSALPHRRHPRNSGRRAKRANPRLAACKRAALFLRKSAIVR